MKGLILAGGFGTRLRPLTHTGPKQLIPIANKPVLFYGMEDLKNAGITDIGIVLGLNMPDRIKEAVGDGSKFGVKVTYVMQGEPKGIAHAVKISRDFTGEEPFVVYLGDNIIKEGITNFVRGFKESKCDARIMITKVRDPQRFGVVELNKKGEVLSVIEKPKEPKSDLALVGAYLFKSSIFEMINKIKPSWRNELEITDAIQRLIDTNHTVEAHTIKGWWKDTGKPEDILEANHLVLDDLKPSNKGTIESSVKILGRVVIGNGTIIKKGSSINGPVIIGKNCVIGPNSFIGPYTSIGDNTVVVGGEIDSSIILQDTRIECGKRILNSLIGRHSQILPTKKNMPQGFEFIVGENSIINI